MAKKKCKGILAALLVAMTVFSSGVAWAVQSSVLTSVSRRSGDPVEVYTYTLTGSPTGANVGEFATIATPDIDGWILCVETDPGTAPDTDWDLTLVDANGADVMADACMNRSATLTQRVISPQPYVRGPVTLTATGTNNADNVVVVKITVMR